MREKDVRTLGIVEIVVAALLLIGMYYVHKSMPIDPPVRVYMIPADSDPCPEPASPISMLFIEDEPTLTYWMDGKKLYFREHEIPEHRR